MTATVEAKPAFVFVHSDVSGINRSKLSRAIVRSHAARSARSSAPRAKKPAALNKSRDTPPTQKSPAGSISPIDENLGSAVDDEKLAMAVAETWLDVEDYSLLVDPVDPLLISQPLLNNPYSKLLIDHYLSTMAVEIPELDAGTPGLLRSRWFPFALNNHSALLNIIILTAGANYINYVMMDQDEQKNVRHCLVQLKHQALQEMRHMAFHAKDHAGDELIAAATKMASFEAMYGESSAFKTHMSGLRNLVELRGGLMQLGLDGLLGRMVCWVDCNSSFLLNTSLYFSDLGAMLPKAMMFDPESFIGGS